MKKLFSLVLCLSLTICFATSVSAAPRYANSGFIYGFQDWDGDQVKPGDQIIKTADECYNALDYVLKWGYDGQVILNPKLADMDNDRLDSAIIYFAGHGDGLSIDLGYGMGISNGTGKDYKNIENLDFNQVQLGVLSACYSAVPGIPSIAKQINDNGAACTIGWKEDVQSPSLKDFNAKFFEHLDNGNNFENTAAGAENDLTNGSTLPSYHPTATVFNYEFFGNKQNTIEKLSNKQSENKKGIESLLHEGLEQYVITDDVSYKHMSGEYGEIENYIKENINNEFNLNDYTIYEKERSKTVQYKPVYFRYNLNGIETDFGYNILIENDKAVLITVAGTPISENTPLTLSENNYTDEELFDIAIEELGFDNEIKNKRASRMYLSATGEILYQVEITYYDYYNNGSTTAFCVGYSFTE